MVDYCSRCYQTIAGQDGHVGCKRRERQQIGKVGGLEDHRPVRLRAPLLLRAHLAAEQRILLLLLGRQVHDAPLGFVGLLLNEVHLVAQRFIALIQQLFLLQELWQFFGSFGLNGAVGLAIAMAMLFGVGVLMLDLNRISGIADVDKLVVRWNIPILRAAVTVLELLFLFGVCTIMSAGAGALLNQLFGIPTALGSAALAALVAFVSLAGLGGMVAAFSATVPVLAVVTLVFGIISVSEVAEVDSPASSKISLAAAVPAAARAVLVSAASEAALERAALPRRPSIRSRPPTPGRASWT